MPPEHRLSDAALVQAAVFGKHPGHGDFLSAGLPDELEWRLSEWLGSSLGPVREQIGPAWPAVCQSRTALRFWLGAEIGHGMAWRGVMRMSCDKVGRNYPLLILSGAAPDSLPTLQVEQDFYIAAEEALADLFEQAVLLPSETQPLLAARLNGFEGAERGLGGHEHMFWAMRASGSAPDLLADLALTDLICGATSRSYWWFSHAEAGGTGVLSCQGLPDPQALSWLITGGAGPES